MGLLDQVTIGAQNPLQSTLRLVLINVTTNLCRIITNLTAVLLTSFEPQNRGGPLSTNENKLLLQRIQVLSLQPLWF
jgi:hypothetical protein